MSKRLEMIGRTFGRLTVIKRANRPPKGGEHIHWRCECACGEFKDINGRNLRSGATVSCGCYSVDINTTHGKKGSREYNAYMSMKQRCLNKNHKMFSRYGGRGISICARWLSSFENFYSDVGDIPDGLTLDRIDNNKGYSPDNVRLATYREQNNNRENTPRFVFDGKETAISDISRAVGISRECLLYRINTMGLSLQEAVERGVSHRQSKAESTEEV